MSNKIEKLGIIRSLLTENEERILKLMNLHVPAKSLYVDNEDFFIYCCTENQISSLISVLEEFDSDKIVSQLRTLFKCKITVAEDSIVIGFSKYFITNNFNGVYISTDSRGYGFYSGSMSSLQAIVDYSSIEDYHVCSNWLYLFEYMASACLISVLCTVPSISRSVLTDSDNIPQLDTALHRVLSSASVYVENPSFSKIFWTICPGCYKFKPRVNSFSNVNNTLALVANDGSVLGVLFVDSSYIYFINYNKKEKLYNTTEVGIPNYVQQILKSNASNMLKEQIYLMLIEMALSLGDIMVGTFSIRSKLPYNPERGKLSCPVANVANKASDILDFIKKSLLS